MNANPSYQDQREKSASEGQKLVSAPSISLPKGGGAIRGIGEKFAANPVTGTGSMTVPIATSPGRSGFGPQLNLTYDSGSGNGPFGFGWSLSLPAITRKTDKGLPRYQDAVESDVFLLSGAEDLVPVLIVQPGGKWAPESLPTRTIDEKTYRIQRYRPRIEGLFARIERWTKISSEEIHWRSISKDNILTIYGKDENSRIADPDHPNRIFSWLICETRDDKGNAITYEYKPENGAAIDLSQAHERNRGDRNSSLRKVNRYLKHVRYGNRTTLLDDLGHRPSLVDQETWKNVDWMFEVIFDYDEGHVPNTLPDPDQCHYSELLPTTGEQIFIRANKALPVDSQYWPVRRDPFSSYRAGFEIRTNRLCRRVHMFHRFPQELGIDDCLVRSTDFSYSESPVASFINSVTQSGYIRQPIEDQPNRYLKKSLPPVEFEYSQVPSPEQLARQPIRQVDPESLENLPIGLDGASYQWMDLDGEGTSGILTEQADGWYYKRNLSANNQAPGDGRTIARFGPTEVVARKPAVGLAGGAQFLDLAGDGQVDLVQMEGALRGFYERTEDANWVPFQPFISWPDLNIHDPDLKFVDLTGDGHADLLITEGETLSWYPSLAEAGFGLAVRINLPSDEEKGPRLVFSDGTQSIYLADLSGDGLSDLVRICNGEVCYWPNLGYGHFGAKVTMDNAPWFDSPDLFDQRRIRLADTDGSGTTDILYLQRSGVQIYFNQSGNSWSEAVALPQFPPVDNISVVQALDLLGNGTACLVWSSPLPGAARRPMHYLALMEEKPHLLIKVRNNLGAETRVHYAPSTKFYLDDKQEGRPWITRLPFPVHVVEKVTITDKWRNTTFSSTYSYHHGYFDGNEREFRGFGRVDQVDSETFGKFSAGNSDSPYITPDQTLYQPPVKTVTWYHTGAAPNTKQILMQFEQEYFPHWFEDMRPGEVNVLGDFQENILPEPDLDAENLTVDEWREALRACKGMLLRQEIYELDVDALEQNEERPVKLFSSAYHNCHVRRLQARGENRHAVFLVTESEAITYHYELDLTNETVRPDPRIVHTLNLELDEYGNVLQSAAVVYPRIGQFSDDILSADSLDLIRRVQQERHLAYTETRYTADYEPSDLDDYRLRVPCEVLTYELTGIGPEDADDLASSDPRDNFYFMLDELRRFQISSDAVPKIAYHELPNRTTPQKRLVEHVQMLFFIDDPSNPGALKEPLGLGQLGRLGLPYETYKLALTEELLDAIFTDVAGHKLDKPIKGTSSARQLLRKKETGGYIRDEAGRYWICSGIAGFAADAAQHFYLPERYTDPFGNVTTLEYDEEDLFIKSSTDALGNVTTVEYFDFRVLAPREMKDINGNRSAVYFDALGLPVAMALRGKGDEADDLGDITDDSANPKPAELVNFFNMADVDVDQARDWLRDATARHIYYFGDDELPPSACGILREQHAKENPNSPLQVAFEYSDGMGSVVVKKIQAEPETTNGNLRWIASGKVILNNKGKPVKQFEPYFSLPDVGHRYEEPEEIGVTPVMYYDSLGRLIRTEFPDGSYSQVEFSPWHVQSFDQNDTVRDSKWYASRNPLDPDQPLPRDVTGKLLATLEQQAAWLAAQHYNTPSLTILDSLGREVVSIAHNRRRDNGRTPVDEKYLTFTKLDAEGKPLWIRDARKNLVMQHIRPPVLNNQATDPVDGSVPCYDIAGNLLYQHSMDAGDRWVLNDAAGKPMFSWDSRGHTFRTNYDELHRPTGSFVIGADPADSNRVIQFEKIIYGETAGNSLTDVQKDRLNIRGKPYQHYDTAGIITNLGRNPATDQDEAYDFKGNLLGSSRQLVRNYQTTPDWSQNPELEENEIFIASTTYDALNRPVNTTSPDGSIYRPTYNEASLLEKVDVNLRRAARPTPFVTNIDYNAKGQRTKIEYHEKDHPILTTYEYDLETFRLIGMVTRRPLHPAVDKRKLQDLTYTYDLVGNITHITDQAQPRVFFDNDCIDASNDYEYDAIYRLIAASGREHRGQDLQPDWDDGPRMGNPIPYNCVEMQNYVEVYRYDPVGNILRMEHHKGHNLDSPGQIIWNRRYQYALDSNRLLATSVPDDPDDLPDYTASPGYFAKYAYDAHGNMTGMPQLTVMKWDFQDQLSVTARQVVNETPPPEKVPEITYYVYDAAGQRVRKVTERQNGSLKDERIYLGGFEIYRKYNGATGTLELERETLHIMDDKQRIALVETKTKDANVLPSTLPQTLIRYQFSNHLGSASLELDDQAQVSSYEEYYPYGSTSYQAVRSQTEAPKRYRYTGKERDEETGFTYHGARYYAPWLGRWTSADPASPIDGWNLYLYAKAEPTRFIDPNGKEDKDFFKGDEEKTDRERALDAIGLAFAPLPMARGVFAALTGQVPTDYLVPGEGSVAVILDEAPRAGYTAAETVDRFRKGQIKKALDSAIDTGVHGQNITFAILPFLTQVGKRAPGSPRSKIEGRSADPKSTAADPVSAPAVDQEHPSSRTKSQAGTSKVEELMNIRALAAKTLHNKLQTLVNQLSRRLTDAVLEKDREFLEHYLTSKQGGTGRVQVLLDVTDPKKANLGLARMFYGTALERMLAEAIKDDPELSKQISFTATQRTYAGGKKPDFNITSGPLSGYFIELTTKADLEQHAKKRAYGERQTIHLSYEINP